MNFDKEEDSERFQIERQQRTTDWCCLSIYDADQQSGLWFREIATDDESYREIQILTGKEGEYNITILPMDTDVCMIHCNDLYDLFYGALEQAQAYKPFTPRYPLTWYQPGVEMQAKSEYMRTRIEEARIASMLKLKDFLDTAQEQGYNDEIEDLRKSNGHLRFLLMVVLMGFLVQLLSPFLPR